MKWHYVAIYPSLLAQSGDFSADDAADAWSRALEILTGFSPPGQVTVQVWPLSNPERADARYFQFERET